MLGAIVPYGGGLARVAVLVLAPLLAGGCASSAQSARTQAFTGVESLESRLERGVTIKADVLLMLGQPDGAGALGGFDALRGAGAAAGPLDAWYYEGVHAGFTAGSGMVLDQNVLLVYFAGDVVDGFMWFSNQSRGTVR